MDWAIHNPRTHAGKSLWVSTNQLKGDFTMTTNIIKETFLQRLSTNVAQFHFRRLLIGLLLVLLAYAVVFINYNLVYAGIAEKVTIQSGDIQLAGILVKPTTPDPHPAIVLLHGSGPQKYSKWYYRIHTNVFVRQGFAVLSYDQRGSGKSQGELRVTGFPDMVNDVIALVDYLHNQPDINQDQIGLYGISQSGWYSPEVAVRTGKIAFIINRVSPPVPWMTAVSHEVKTGLIGEGYTDDEISEILQLQNRIWQYYVDSAEGESDASVMERDAINAILSDTLNRPGGKAFFGDALTEYDPEELKAKASRYAYDPYPYLAEVDIPMLYILAEDDVNIPFEASFEVLEQLKLDFNKDISIQTYPVGGHYLYRWDWFPLEGFYVPGYLDLIGSWAGEQIE